MWSWHCFNIWGTVFEDVFLILKSSIRSWCTVSLFIISFSAISGTLNLQSVHTKVHTASTFVSVFCVFDCLLLASSCTSSLNHLFHSKILNFFIACPSEDIFKRANLLLPLLPIFTQNVTLYTVQDSFNSFSINSIKWTHTASSTAWLIWSASQ